MLRIVLDTNVLVSALIRKGKPRDLWNVILQGKVNLITSEELLTEFSEVIARPRLQKYIDSTEVVVFQELLVQKAELVKITEYSQQLTEDPDDNIIIETAIAGDAEYIISGDMHLLRIKKFNGIQIITVAEIMRIIEFLGKRL